MRGFKRALLVVSVGAAIVAGLSPSAGAVTADGADGSAVTATTASVAATASSAQPAPRHHPTRDLCATNPGPDHATCFSVIRTDVTKHIGPFAASTAPAGYSPDNLQGAYNVPSATAGSGQTVAIVDAYDDPTAEADLQVYRAQYGLPVCTTANGCFRKVAQDGSVNYPPGDLNWAGEISLDLDMVSAICPNCHILLVEANDATNTNLGEGVDEAVALGAKFVSNSYGSQGEEAAETGWDQFYDHPGVAITAAAGDYGYADSFPAISPYVTAVGGTTLLQDSTTSRGWTETAWSGTGSGCSQYEPKPSFQTDSGCPDRTMNDVSAVADPNTGVAVYDSYLNNGWMVFGGTSASSPIIASVYALAGTPGSADQPNQYPYASPSALNDVTSGSNGSCGGTYLCTAGPGYDAPTGLGTPDGLLAFTAPGPRGTVSGTVTDAATGKAVSGANVSVPGASGITDASGSYSLSAPPGSYTMTVSAYGYTKATVSITITAGSTVTQDVQLTPVPTVAISGTVTDGSGAGWPLYAKVEIDGTPVSTFTSPYTGQYSVRVPAGSTYTLHVTPQAAGYQSADQAVTVGTTDLTQDVAVPIDATACDAPGYGLVTAGISENFDEGSTPPGWTVTDNTGNGAWAFNNPGGEGNLTGGSGGFAIADGSIADKPMDTIMTSPVADLTNATAPELTFDTEGLFFGTDVATVDLSLDGGSSWSMIWQNPPGGQSGTTISIPLPQAAGQADARVKFHFTGLGAIWWEVDDLLFGQQGCLPASGGMVAGQVTDGNTGQLLDGAKVTSDSGQSASTGPVTDDPAVGDGFYEMFVPAGSHQLTTTRSAYTPASQQLSISPGTTTKASFTLQAGHLVVTPSVTGTVTMGSAVSKTFTVTNNGTATVHATLADQGWTSTVLTAAGSQVPTSGVTGAKLQRVSGAYSPFRLAGTAAGKSPAASAATGPWTNIANYPQPIMDNAATVAPDGKVYSVGGVTAGIATNDAYVYDPVAGTWSQIASMSSEREAPVAAFIGGKLYVTGGWDINGNTVTTLDIYDPSSNTWTQGAPVPAAYSGAAVAVLGGKMYVVGGCTSSDCENSDVWVYDPGTNTWTQAASYPQPIAWEACGGIDVTLYCAGGGTYDGSTSYSTTSGYSYDPADNTWEPIAAMPFDLAGSGYATANGSLLMSGGSTEDWAVVTNAGLAYDPASDSWSELPNANVAAYRGGSACGFYRVGGASGGFSGTPMSELLPGYSACGQSNAIGWLSESPTSLTIAPGQTETVTVTMNAADASVDQPGTYTGRLDVVNDSPYPDALSVAMSVTPPKTWGKIAGTVTGQHCDGTITPLDGATVTVSGKGVTFGLTTDSSGQFGEWLTDKANPLTVIASSDSWLSQTQQVKLKAGSTVTANFTLPQSQC
jgi:N-acetylneuraminic acid mutarotase